MRKLPIPSDLLSRIPKRAIAAVIVAGALGVGGWQAWHGWQLKTAEEAAIAQRAHEADATRLAQQVGVSLTAVGEKLDRLAEDPKVVGALTGAPDARLAVGQTLGASIPGTLLLRLVPAGTVQPDESQHPPLTYSSIALLRQAAAQQKPVAAELHLGGTPDAHVALVRRVPPAGDPVGFLHLALDPKVVADTVATLDGKEFDVELRQAMPGAPPLVIAKQGGAVDGRIDVVQAAVPGTIWQLVLRQRGSGRESGAGPAVGPLLLPAGGLLLAALAVLALLRRRGGGASAARAGTVETSDYQGAVRAILEGQYPGLEALLPGTPARPLPAAPHASEAFTPLTARTLEIPALEAADAPTPVAEPAAAAPAMAQAAIDPVIFRSYDIRGVVGTSLTNDAMAQLGRAIGSEAQALGQQTVVVARDGRVSSVSLQESLVEGLLAAGCDVLEIGLVPTPVLYFATHYLDTRTGVMITGSHNPPEYNGLKIVLNGKALSGDAIQAIRRRVEQQDYTSGRGTLQQTEIVPDYIRRITEEIPVSLGRTLKVVVDCGNGVPGIVAPHILRAIGHDVIELYCEVDGEFPNHHPDPSEPANLEDLIIMVRHEDADLGLAFDGDGDRLGVVDRNGRIVWADRQLMLFARDVLSRNPGATIVYDVKCSRRLAEVIRDAGGEPLMWKTGHSLIKSKMAETGALLGGEMSGHICFKERWYGFDDALYAAARLLEILVNATQSPEQVFAALPDGVATPELKIPLPEERHTEFMERVGALADFPDGEITEIDGLRVDLPNCWGLVRPSNTTPSLVLRFEGDDADALDEIKDRFRHLLLAVDPDLELPF
ncbi:MAG: phosphomannomutase/phosphoglucomutase [Gammaproteobacteria bacterium]